MRAYWFVVAWVFFITGISIPGGAGVGFIYMAFMFFVLGLGEDD